MAHSQGRATKTAAIHPDPTLPPGYFAAGLLYLSKNLEQESQRRFLICFFFFCKLTQYQHSIRVNKGAALTAIVVPGTLVIFDCMNDALGL